MIIPKVALGVAFCCNLFLFGTSIVSTAKPVPVTQRVESVVSHLVGVMDTTAQAMRDPQAPKVRMTTCRVNILGKKDAVYLYQEQALVESLDQPYRQRFLAIRLADTPETVESQALKITEPDSVIGICNQELDSRQLSPLLLGKSPCSVYLKPKEEGYIGITEAKGCPTNIRGAVKITNTIILHQQGMDTWDRGFDQAGNQVWGAQDKPYEFRWIDD